MTNGEAVKLVLEAGAMSCGGEVFVTKMPVMRIVDLAQAMIALLAPAFDMDPQKVPLSFIGGRSGEKLYEELLTAEEMSRALETERLFLILPALQGISGKIQYSYRGGPAGLYSETICLGSGTPPDRTGDQGFLDYQWHLG